MDESSEYLLAADLVIGEVDRSGPLCTGLGGGELGEGAVRAGGVVMPEVLGQHLPQVALI